MAPRSLRLDAPNSNPLALSESSNTSSSPTNTRLTPNSDDDESDPEMLETGESIRLPSRRGQVIDEKAMLEDEEEGIEEEEQDEGEYKEFLTRQRRRESMSTVQSYQLYTPDEERAVIRKFDRRLVLFVALLYMLSFLDRSSTSAHFPFKLAMLKI